MAAAKLILSVDRIEGDRLICENINNGETFLFDMAIAPAGVKDGDILNFEGGLLTPDPTAAKHRKKHLQKRLDGLFGRKPHKGNNC